MITVLLPPGALPAGAEAAGRHQPLEESEQHHLRVRRARDGERVLLRDGAGLVGVGRIVAVGKGWEIEIDEAERHERPAGLTLAVGAGDRERFGWMVEKAAELGVTRIVPLVTARAADVATRLREAHVDKLRRQALEALKQCGAAWAPEVGLPEPLGAFAARDGARNGRRDAPRDATRHEAGSRWLADAAGEPPPPQLDDSLVSIVIGPEGGLESAERALLLEAGFRPVALAPDTLRFETAALAAAAVVAAARLRGAHG